LFRLHHLGQWDCHRTLRVLVTQRCGVIAHGGLFSDFNHACVKLAWAILGNNVRRSGQRFAAWKIEAKLLAGVLIEAMVFALVPVLLVVEVATCLVFLWLVSLATFFKLAGVAALIAFAAALYHNVWSVGEDPSDEPLREAFNAYPELESLVHDVAFELKCCAPESAAFLLSPIAWRRFGCDFVRLRDRQEISIPVNHTSTALDSNSSSSTAASKSRPTK
jgi:hypothetical protein